MFRANPEGKDFGDGNWVAQWSTDVFHQGLFGYLNETPMVSSSAYQRNYSHKPARETLDQHGARSCHRPHLRWHYLQVHWEIGKRI